ncbi:hypothetical protein OF83DRAFT_631050 [Amylostereum chailletii]|nr:hypothetical protein OF83DRAFT_631050 [Amylostereum chailletii]
MNLVANPDPRLRKDPRSPIPYYLNLVLPALVDVITNIILLAYLTRSLKSTLVERARRTINRLVILVWECALPPTLCALATLTLYVVQSKTGHAKFWDLQMQRVLTPIYVISLLIALNGRSKFPAPEEEGATTDARFTTAIEIEHDMPMAPPSVFSPVDRRQFSARFSTTSAQDTRLANTALFTQEDIYELVPITRPLVAR